MGDIYPPSTPPLQECWLFYQHPNVEFWSNSLHVPNIASRRGGDVFMTTTLIAACRTGARLSSMFCISCSFLVGQKLRLASPYRESKGQLSEPPSNSPLVAWGTWKSCLCVPIQSHVCDAKPKAAEQTLPSLVSGDVCLKVDSRPETQVQHLKGLRGCNERI